MKFTYYLSGNGEILKCDNRHNPAQFVDVILIEKSYFNGGEYAGLDAMVAIADIPANNCIVFGTFNLNTH